MAGTQPCDNRCPSPELVKVPGTEGVPGQNGTNGLNAFTTLTGPFTVPVVGNSVTISVVESFNPPIGSVIVVDGPAHLQVTANPDSLQITGNFLGYVGDVAPGTVIAASANVGPSGTQPGYPNVPLLQQNNLSDLANKQTALQNLHLATDPLAAFFPNLHFALTSNSMIPTGANLTITAAGSYLLHCVFLVDLLAATFANVSTLGAELLRTNNTSGPLVNTLMAAQIPETFGYDEGLQYQASDTLTFGQFSIVVPYKTANNNDNIALQCDISTAPASGTLQITSAYLIAVRIYDQTLT